MAGFDGDESAATSGADFVMRDKLAFDDRLDVSRLDYTRDEFHGTIARRRAQELDRILSRDGAGRFVRAALLHQMPRSRPVAVTIEERADNAAAQHPFKCFVLLTRLPLSDNLFAIRKTADVQTLRVRRSTAETREIRGVSLLNAFNHG